MIFGVEWILIPLIILIIILILAVKFPSFRTALGAMVLVLGIILSLIPVIGIFLGILPILLGVFLLVWGLASRSEKKEEIYRPIRICPKCGRDLSQFPDDIKRCPYCGNELT